MKLYRIAEYKGQAGLVLCDEPDPPAPVGRQVVVRLRASSINFRDVQDMRGDFLPFMPLCDNRIPNSDGAGEVVAVGAQVTRVRPGDRVAATFHGSWIAGDYPRDMNILGRGASANDGMLAEYTTVDESELVRIPDALSFEEAATLPCAGVTAWWALFGKGELRPGQTVLVQGTGGVSIFALQFARLAGATVIATTTTPAKADILSRLGANAVIDASDGADWAGAVAEIVPNGVDLAVDIGGKHSLEQSILAVRPSGRISLVGSRSSPLDSLSGMFAMRGIHLNPVRVGAREHFEQMNSAITANALKPVVDRIFDFGQTREAFDYFLSGRHIGKVVIRI